MAGTPYDSALELRAESNIGATATTTAIDVEGGSPGTLHLAWQTPTGTSPTLQVDLEQSVDGGSNYYKTNRTPVFTALAVTPAGYTYWHIAYPVYIKKSLVADTYRGSAPRTKVRIVSTMTGSATPLFVNFRAWLGMPIEGSTPELERLPL